MSDTDDPILRRALIDSRQRWRDLVTVAADLAFETDAQGRFVFLMPEEALGWPAGFLVGQPAEDFLADSVGTDGFNPFRITEPVHRRRAWFKQANAAPMMLIVSAAPFFDRYGRIAGTRGVGVDWSDYDEDAGQIASALRHGQVLDHIVSRIAEEVLAPRMMSAALDALVRALGAEGAAIIGLLDGCEPKLQHSVGGQAQELLPELGKLFANTSDTADAIGKDGRPMRVVVCQTRFGAHLSIAFWRMPGARNWDDDDRLLMTSAARVIRMILEREAIQQEMMEQARTDPLTGLLNRRAFLDEMARHIGRLDGEEQPGTLMFADLDSFKPVNDQLGHEMGDQVLRQTAAILRDTVRPSDLVARLGGDEFALWMDGADHMTAAERADTLCAGVPDRLHAIVGDPLPSPTLSIGIATRPASSNEPIDHLLRRADNAMYQAKRTGRGQWRVAREEED